MVPDRDFRADREFLLAIAGTLNVDEHDSVCPDVDRIASMDGDPIEKADVFTKRLLTNVTDKRRPA